LLWFGQENRRVAPRRRYDNYNAWIRLGGTLVRQCEVLDISRTGVRVRCTNAQNIPNTFILILSKGSTGRPARVKWRNGNELGAEFFS